LLWIASALFIDLRLAMTRGERLPHIYGIRTAAPSKRPARKSATASLARMSG
jgi:hypothetical protein